MCHFYGQSVRCMAHVPRVDHRWIAPFSLTTKKLKTKLRSL
jgi:hypothetical protein